MRPIKGIVNGKERGGTLMYKVRFKDGSKEDDEWVLPDQVSDEQVASFNKRKAGGGGGGPPKKQKADAAEGDAEGGAEGVAEGGDEDEDEEKNEKEEARLDTEDDGIPVEKGAWRPPPHSPTCPA